MNPRERLLTIRLMEKLRDNQEYANHLGLTGSMEKKSHLDKQEKKPVK